MILRSVQTARIITPFIFLVIFSITIFSQTNVNNISELRALTPGSVSEVNVAGYYSNDDGGGGTFIWDANSRVDDNGGTIIIPNSNPSQGRWIRDTSGYDHYNVKWFGARGQDNPAHNDRTYIIQCIKAVKDALDINIVFFPIGIYQLDDRILITNKYEGLIFEGENLAFKNESVFPTEDGITPLDHHRVDIYWSPVSEFRVVDEDNSAVLKRTSTSTSQIIVFPEDGGVSDVTFKNLAFNGNRWEERETRNSNIQLMQFSTTGYSVRFENIATYASRHSGFATRTPVIVEDILSYSNNWHGISDHGYGIEDPPIFRNVEVHHSGNDEQLTKEGKTWYGPGQGINANGPAIYENVWAHHNWDGMKTSTNRGWNGADRHVTFKNSIFEYNRGKGIQNTGDNPDLVVTWEGNTIVRHNGDVGFRNTQSKEVRVVGSLHLKNNGIEPVGEGLAAALNVKNFNADEILIEDHVEGGDAYSGAAIFFGDNIISNIKILNNDIVGLRINDGQTNIKSGEIINNKSIGISINDDAQLEITNVKFGDTQSNPTQTQYEIYGSSRATLNHANLDFTDSQVNPGDRIVVGTENEVTVDNNIKPTITAITSPFDLDGTISWSNEGVGSYLIQVATNSNFDSAEIVFVKEVEGTSTQVKHLSDSRLEPGTDYWVRVYAINGTTSISPWSDVVSFSTAGASEQPPPSLVSPADGATVSIPTTISWESGGGTPDEFQYQLSKSNTFDPLVHTQQGSWLESLQLSDSILDHSETYYWRVRAKYDDTWSNWSSSRSFTTTSEGAPDKPQLTSPSNGASGVALQPLINWQDASGADTYNLVVSKSSELTDPVINETGIAVSEYQVTSDLDSGALYYWRVTAVNVHGTTQSDNIWSFSTLSIVQHLYPSSDVSNVMGNWSIVDGGQNNDIDTAIGKLSVGDGTYIITETLGGTPAKLKLKRSDEQPVITPQLKDGWKVANIRASVMGNNNIRVRLYEGETQRKEWLLSNLTEALSDNELTLTSSEASEITDAGNMYIEVALIGVV